MHVIVQVMLPIQVKLPWWNPLNKNVVQLFYRKSLSILFQHITNFNAVSLTFKTTFYKVDLEPDSMSFHSLTARQLVKPTFTIFSV